MSEKEESGSDDEDYVPSDPEDGFEKEEDEEDENSASGDDDVVETNKTACPLEKESAISKIAESLETEDERRQRLKSLFEDFIGVSVPILEGLPNRAFSQSSSSTGIRTTAEAVGSKADHNFTHNGIDEVDEKLDCMFESPRSVDTTEKDIINGSWHNGKEKQVSKVVQGEKRKSPSGLKNAISNLSKKSKMSILDKTAQDWGAFKDETGIQEELLNHNRGRQGYIERVEFLTRADYRQFEKERDARNAVRGKK